MKCTIVVGSHREDSQSSKVGAYISHKLEELDAFSDTYTLSLKGNPLPFYQDDWKKDVGNQKIWEPIAKELDESQCFVIISPEWHGMVPAGLKNFFLLAGTNHLGHKPALIVTVSDSRGGAFPVAELRMSSYKNSHICYIPEQVIIRKVKEVLNDNALDEEKKVDFYIKSRIGYCLNVLAEYAKGLALVRESGVIDTTHFKNGMS